MLTLKSIRAIWTSIIWTFISSWCGLIQLVMIYVFSVALDTDVDVEAILKDGLLIFFSLGLLSGILIEFFYDASIDLSNIGVNTRAMLFFTPLIVLFISTVFYAAIFFKEEMIATRVYAYFETILLIFSLLYTLILKSIIIYRRQ